jgi:hypothetical protein
MLSHQVDSRVGSLYSRRSLIIRFFIAFRFEYLREQIKESEVGVACACLSLNGTWLRVDGHGWPGNFQLV